MRTVPFLGMDSTAFLSVITSYSIHYTKLYEVRDPEIRYLPSGLSVTSFAIAVNSRYRSNNELKEEVSFFDVRNNFV